MAFELVETKDRDEYNRVVTHPLQSFEWGEFREKTGVGVVRRGLFAKKKIESGFTFTLHKVPKTSYTIGYLPKGQLPSEDEIEELIEIGKANKCVFIQIEPNVVRKTWIGGEGREENKDKVQKFERLIEKSHHTIKSSFHPLFTKYNFVLDISRGEEELLASFHSKTRYNIRVAQKHDVTVVFDSSQKAFDDYLALLLETTQRQAFYAHTPSYHRTLFETLGKKHNKEGLSYHIARAIYTDTAGHTHTLAAWVLFAFHDTLYYPYGASSNLYRFTMASNLIAWESILYGKKLGLLSFDMWGALGNEPDVQDAWYGFHKFKSGYNPSHVEYVGSYDIVINPNLYRAYMLLDRARWGYLRLRKR